MDLDFKKQEAQINLGVKQQTAQIDLQKAQMGAQVDQQKAEGDLAMQERQMQADARKGALDEKMAMDKHALNMEMQKTRAEAVGKEAKGGKD